MAKRLASVLVWTPRVLGILLCLFLSMFALDAFGGGKTFLQGLRDFLLHISPMVALLGIVVISWRWEWVGGAVFTALAAVYAYWAYFVIHQGVWMLPIAGFLLVVGVLFLLSWRHRREARHVS